MLFVKGCFTVEVFKSLMVSMECKFLVTQKILPMSYFFYYGLEFRILGSVVKSTK